MCGRFSISTTKEKIEQQLSITISEAIVPNYNIAPTQAAYVLTGETPQRLQQFYWGLIPHWSREAQLNGKLINARKEGIQQKPSFRMPIRYKRCLVPADSFYEWRMEGKEKIPYRILLNDGNLMYMAGIWDEWQQGGRVIKTFSIITTPPNTEMATIHKRMPLILDTEAKQQAWLNETNLNKVLAMLQPLESGKLKMYRVSNRVNSVENNAPTLHEEVAEPPTLF